MSQRDDASGSEEIAGLDREMEELTLQKKACEDRIRQLRSEEDPRSGRYFAQEIFQEQQRKLSLEVEIEFRRKRKNRILLEQGQKDWL
jgi:hypothetical protein